MNDLISRQAAIDAFKKELTVGESKGNYVTICSAISYKGAKQILEGLPSVTSERKTGRWLISEGTCEPDYMECSRCKWITEYYGGLEEWGYCPNCGARMARGEEHGHEYKNKMRDGRF